MSKCGMGPKDAEPDFNLLHCGAAIYARVASIPQDNPLGAVNAQIAQCERFAAARKLHIVDTYSDPGSSGIDENRPALRKMFGDAAGHPRPFDVILVYSYSRLFRDIFLYDLYSGKLEKAGIDVVSVSEATHRILRLPDLFRVVISSERSRKNAK